MSRKDYIAFARMVAGLKDVIPEEARRLVAREIALILASDNGRFDKGRFYSACEVERND